MGDRGARDKRPVWMQRVSCPLRGDRDVESCLVCPHLRDLHLTGRDPWVLCHPPRVDSSLTLFGLYARE